MTGLFQSSVVLATYPQVTGWLPSLDPRPLPCQDLCISSGFPSLGPLLHRVRGAASGSFLWSFLWLLLCLTLCQMGSFYKWRVLEAYRLLLVDVGSGPFHGLGFIFHLSNLSLRGEVIVRGRRSSFSFLLSSFFPSFLSHNFLNVKA